MNATQSGIVDVQRTPTVSAHIHIRCESCGERHAEDAEMILGLDGVKPYLLPGERLFLKGTVAQCKSCKNSLTLAP